MQFDIFILDYNINQQVKIAHSSILRALLRVGKMHKITQSLDEALLQYCGVQKQHDWPLAAFEATASGEAMALQYWRAEPVSLSLLRDSFALEQKVMLNPDEMRDLTVLFCQFFAQDGLHFSVNQQGGWLVHHQRNWAVETQHIQHVLGGNIAQFQAVGADANQLRGLQNQLQMLLHEHPINQAREAANLPICNSLWLYGGGKLPVQVHNSVDYFVGTNTLVQSLAMRSNKPLFSYQQLETWLTSEQNKQHTKTVLVLNNQAEIDQLEGLIKKIKLNKFKQLNIYFNCNHQSYFLSHQLSDDWKFWRRNKPFEAYFV